jgi:hypothetical protein
MNRRISKEMVISVLDATHRIIAEANEDGTRCELPESNAEFADLVLESISNRTMNQILINPPPTDGRCHCCGKIAVLQKTFRETNPLGGVSASWECKECIPLNYQGYIEKSQQYKNNIVDEFCPRCEAQVVLEKVFMIQECPSCTKPIKPCAMCDMDKIDCGKCPLGCC